MEEYSQLLKKAGLSITAQRLFVLQAIESQPHTTAEEVFHSVKSEIGTISKQSVYDVLSVCSDKGLIRRIQPSKSPARYEHRVGDNHHHMVCRSCGVVKDVDCAVGEAPCLTPSEDHGFIVDEAEVIYWGYCPKCQKEKNSRNKIYTQTKTKK